MAAFYDFVLYIVALIVPSLVAIVAVVVHKLGIIDAWFFNVRQDISRLADVLCCTHVQYSFVCQLVCPSFCLISFGCRSVGRLSVCFRLSVCLSTRLSVFVSCWVSVWSSVCARVC